MVALDSLCLSGVPDRESDTLEYKSSAIPDRDLKRELQNAASAFWNSGGGLFIAGVDDAGVVDGGILSAFGKQSVDDWLGQVVAEVKPPGVYKYRVFRESESPQINAGKCVLSVEFAQSPNAPHQAPDGRYYIRVGAHTVRAPHFVVEALWARRHFMKPRLVHLAGLDPWTTVSDFLSLDVIAVTDAAAVDVQIDLDPRPAERHLDFPILVPVIDAAHAFSLRFEVARDSGFASDLTVQYCDLAGNKLTYQVRIESSRCVPAWNRRGAPLETIAQELAEIKDAIRRIE